MALTDRLHIELEGVTSRYEAVAAVEAAAKEWFRTAPFVLGPLHVSPDHTAVAPDGSMTVLSFRVDCTVTAKGAT